MARSRAVIQGEATQSDVKKRRKDSVAMTRKADEIAALFVPYLSDWRCTKLTVNLKREIKDKVGIRLSTVDDYIQRLKKRGCLTEAVVVNATKTPLCHEFRVGLRVNFYQVGQQAKHAGYPEGVSAWWLIDTLIEESRTNEKTKKHLVITEGVVIHGAKDRDIELTVMTDNGSRALANYIFYDLSKLPYITEITSNMVSYSHARQSADWKAKHARGQEARLEEPERAD